MSKYGSKTVKLIWVKNQDWAIQYPKIDLIAYGFHKDTPPEWELKVEDVKGRIINFERHNVISPANFD